MATHKITEERFNEIKKFLNTPVKILPSIRYVAESFGYSSGTISRINQCDTFAQYKQYQLEALGRRVDNDIRATRHRAKRAKSVYEEFNDEWFFHEND